CTGAGRGAKAPGGVAHAGGGARPSRDPHVKSARIRHGWAISDARFEHWMDLMVRALFGTDGIRGRANTEPMTADLAMKVAMAAGLHFRKDHGRRPLAVIGKDTRLSGYMLEPAMVAGFTAIGMDVVLVGPMPTPAVAMLTPSLRADLGVV